METHDALGSLHRLDAVGVCPEREKIERRFEKGGRVHAHASRIIWCKLSPPLEQPAQGHEHKPSSHVGPLDDNRKDRRSPEDISADEYRDRKQPVNL